MRVPAEAQLPGREVALRQSCDPWPQRSVTPRDREVHVVRIFVVDDNPAVRRYLRAVLEQQSSWRVCGEAQNGAEALQKFFEVQPDLILLDQQMPGLSGVDVARQITQMDPRIPILMLTLHLSSQLAEAAQQAGIRGACAKQDIGSVVEAVEVLLREQTYFKTPPAAGT